jgi:hypothetical protein
MRGPLRVILGAMRGASAALAALLLGVACGSADATPSTTEDESKTRPALKIASLDPLTVKGTRFVPSERVKLLVNAGRPRTKAAKVDDRGRFTISFRLDLDRCAGVVVQAFGTRGSRAMVDVTGPNCAPTGSAPGRDDADPPYSPPGERP